MLPEQFQATEGYLYNLPQSEQVMSLCVILSRTLRLHSCQPLLGVNLSPVFMNLYFPYAGQGLLFFHWWQRHFEFQLACVAVEGRSNVVLNKHARLQTSHPQRFLSLLHYASQSAFGDGVCWLLIWQFFSLFAQFKTTAKSHENYVFLYPFSNLAIPPQNNEETVFYTGKLYGLTGMRLHVCVMMWLLWEFLPLFQLGICNLICKHLEHCFVPETSNSSI